MVLTAMAAAALGATRATGSGTVAAAAVQEVWRMVQEEREEAWLLGGGEATAAGGAWVGEATSVEVGWTHSRATLAAEVCQVEADTSTGGHGGGGGGYVGQGGATSRGQRRLEASTRAWWRSWRGIV